MNENLNQRVQLVKDAFFGTVDLVNREVHTQSVQANLLFLDAMVDTKQLELSILRPIMEYKSAKRMDLEALKGIVSSGCNMRETQDFDEAVQSISSGEGVFIVDGLDNYIVFHIRKGIVRSITEPPTSSVIKGPREGFVEDIKTNMVLLRRRLRSNKLVFKTMTMGRISETTVAIAYVEGVVKSGILQKVTERLESIDIDGILDSSYITKILEARPYSIFKQVGNTEKPDIAAGKLLDGRIVILVDGTPLALTVPFIFVEDFEDVQDEYKRSARVTFLRVMRICAVFFAVMLPALFVAVQQHQYRILPLQLLITILNATTGIPFSPTIEMIVALVLFEILGEASIRMPRHIGMALSVVGALVLGETAVKAGLLSSLTVLIVALSGIGIFAIPDEVGALSVIRMFLVIVGGLMGIYGILACLIVVFAYLCIMETFDVPYLSPFAPIMDRDLKDFLFKTNLTDAKYRTGALNLNNKKRLINKLPR